MQHFIDLTTHQYTEIWKHLLPEPSSNEYAAFIFAKPIESTSSLVLKARDFCLIERDDFQAQYDDFIELSDEARVSIIKKAHKTNTALIELHSHPFDSRLAAAFSLTDLNGFRETVPHMWWRLPNRPYAAIVVAPCGFDSLVWLKDPYSPECLTSLRVDEEVLEPTNMTFGGKHVIEI